MRVSARSASRCYSNSTHSESSKRYQSVRLVSHRRGFVHICLYTTLNSKKASVLDSQGTLVALETRHDLVTSMLLVSHEGCLSVVSYWGCRVDLWYRVYCMDPLMFLKTDVGGKWTHRKSLGSVPDYVIETTATMTMQTVEKSFACQW